MLPFVFPLFGRLLFVASLPFDFHLNYIRFSFDYLNVPYSVHFLRFGDFFVVNVWCCSYFL